MITRTLFSLALGLAIFLTGCDEVTNVSPDEQTSSITEVKSKNHNMGPESDGETILDIAASNEDFSILAQAVIFAGLDETLDGRRQFTVFAPTNDAFSALLEALGLTAEELLVEANKELVTNILLYHVAPGERLAEDVIESDKIRTLLKKFADVVVDNGSVQIGNEENGFANIIATDIEASNGIIHVIDAVLVPPTNGNSN